MTWLLWLAIASSINFIGPRIRAHRCNSRADRGSICGVGLCSALERQFEMVARLGFEPTGTAQSRGRAESPVERAFLQRSNIIVDRIWLHLDLPELLPMMDWVKWFTCRGPCGGVGAPDPNLSFRTPRCEQG